ncbi:hypothetical protein [Tellurirhabdus rosea]|uniref:hypothetical protein n=1 Tax=Tellurirhabdus rosea TaxID=2674997 RepID=UPI002254CEA8|nr:hypothetical protein [Tellurirhabdus rosea]
MQKILHYSLLLLALTVLFSCEDKAKNPFPEIKNGVHFVARPDPLPATVTAANVNTIPVSLTGAATATASFTTQSLNANEIERVDAYVSHVRGTTVTPTAAAAPNGVLLKPVAALNGKDQIPLVEMLSKVGLGASDLRANDRLRVRFVAVMKDGRTFSATNSGPGITQNPMGTPFTPLLDVLIQ